MAHSEPKKPWTFLAYIAADNNLSDNGLIDIEELCKTGSSDKVHAAVQIDTYGEHDGSIRYEITPRDSDGVGHRTVVQRLSESDSGDPRVLKNFLTWGLQRYPADRRLVVIWNHGSGFRSVRRDIGYDDFGSSLDMPEITDAFTRAGIGLENKIALLGFDACLMNMLEIANHFSDQVEIIVGSQQTEPGDGWPYDKVLALMNKNPSSKDLAKGIVKAYIKDYKDAGQANVTQSAVLLARTDTVVKALSALGKALVKVLSNDRAGIRKARLQVQTYEYADYVDLLHFSTLLISQVLEVASKAESVIKALKACVIVSENYGFDVENSNGLSVWFPTNAQQYASYRSKYLQLKCNRKPEQRGWIDFLDAYFGG
jgi:hypothetical protein